MKKRGLYFQERGVEKVASSLEIEKALQNQEGFLWLDLEGVSEAELAWLKEVFHFHPLTLEDCLHRNQRPKIEDYGAYLFVVLYVFQQKVFPGASMFEELHVFLAPRFLVTVHALPCSPLFYVWERCEEDRSIFSHGPAFIMHLLSDAIADAFFPLLDKVESEIDELEDAVVTSPKRDHLECLFALKKELILYRKVINPQCEVYHALSRRAYSYIDDKIALYFRDVYDHFLKIAEAMESHRDLLAYILEAYLTAISNRQNEVMTRLTLMATIFMPLSFIVGFFGMNFSFIPWENFLLFLVILVAMLILPYGMLIWFRKRGWLEIQKEERNKKEHGKDLTS